MSVMNIAMNVFLVALNCSDIFVHSVRVRAGALVDTSMSKGASTADDEVFFLNF